MDYWGSNFFSAVLTMAFFAAIVPYSLPKLGVRGGWRWLPVGLVVSIVILVFLQFIVAFGFLCITYGAGHAVTAIRDDVSGGIMFLFEMGTETAAIWLPVLVVRLAFYAHTSRSE